MPIEWNVARVMAVSFVISAFGVGQNLLFVHLARPLASGGAQWWPYFACPSITDNQVISASFLALNTCIQLSIFTARTEGPFWTRRPGMWVLVAFLLGVLTTTLISALWTIKGE